MYFLTRRTVRKNESVWFFFCRHHLLTVCHGFWHQTTGACFLASVSTLEAGPLKSR